MQIQAKIQMQMQHKNSTNSMTRKGDEQSDQYGTSALSNVINLFTKYKCKYKQKCKCKHIYNYKYNKNSMTQAGDKQSHQYGSSAF